MRVIICGGRTEGDTSAGILGALIEGLAARYRDELTIVHGAARGVDERAGVIARSLGVAVEEFPAGWEKHGRAAGHVRNQAMLEAGADLVFAVKAGFNWRLDRGGTEDMARRAHKAGVPTYVIQRMGESDEAPDGR